jgi:hypothetical protein
MSRGVLGGDAGELQFVPPILGLTHPTGYPLQVLLHKVWSVVPIGTVAYRLNLLDAAVAALAVAVLALCGRLLSGRWLPALLGALAFAFGELWWSQAVTGDKYTLNGLFLALALLLYLRWRAAPSERRLQALALVYGLSLTHHRSMLLVAPALVAGLLLDGWRPRGWRPTLRLLAVAAAPLALYLYLPWAGNRGLPPGAWRVDTPGALLEYLLDRGYTSQIRPDAALAGRLVEESRVLLSSFGPLGVVLGMLGLARSSRRDVRLALVLLLAFLPQAVLGASYLLESNYTLPRHWVFYLPAFLIWSLWLTLGIAALLDAAERSIGRLDRRPLVFGAAVTATFLVVQGVTVWARAGVAMVRAQYGAETLDGYRQDLQRSSVAERFGRLAFEAAGPRAIVVCDWEQATVLWYLQRVEGQRPDVEIHYPIETLDENLARAQRETRPLYVSRTLPGLARRGVPSSAGPLLQLLPGPAPGLPSDATPVDARLQGGVTLAGLTYHVSDLRPGGVVPVTLFWRAEQPLEEDYAVSIRLLAADGQILAQHDERHPALGTSPTGAWRPGDLIGDYHELALGNRLAPGSYRLAVVMYRPDPLLNLRLLDSAGQPTSEIVELAPFQLQPRQAGPLDLISR